MTISVHNPDQYMAGLRQIIAEERKRMGLLPKNDGTGSTISAISLKPTGATPPMAHCAGVFQRNRSSADIKRGRWARGCRDQDCVTM